MRKTLLFSSLITLVLLIAVSDASAQFLRFGGRRGVSFGLGYGSPYYGGGYGNYSGRGYGNYYGWPNYYGSGYYGSRYYGGLGSYYNNSYYPQYYSSSSYAPYYYSTPTYYSDAPSDQYIQQSGYSDANAALITVFVPTPDARVWFDGAPTTQTGTERFFNTPSLQQAGTYTIKASWTSNGQQMNQERQVQVQPGQSVTVDFRTNQSEKLPTPIRKE